MSLVDLPFRPAKEDSGRQRSSRSRSPMRCENETMHACAKIRTKTESTRKFDATRPTDAILPMREPYMQHIVMGEKTYELRKCCLKPSIKRIWFYFTAPQSSIEYVCEILPAKTRKSGDAALEEDGLGNEEVNARHKSWEGYDFAHKILSVYRIEKPVTLDDLMNEHGMKSAPRGLVYAPQSLLEFVEWEKQEKMR